MGIFAVRNKMNDILEYIIRLSLWISLILSMSYVCYIQKYKVCAFFVLSTLILMLVFVFGVTIGINMKQGISYTFCK